LLSGTSVVLAKSSAGFNAIIILTAGVFYLLSIMFGARGGIFWKLLPRRHLEA
jgi:hypothetical protein